MSVSIQVSLGNFNIGNSVFCVDSFVFIANLLEDWSSFYVTCNAMEGGETCLIVHCKFEGTFCHPLCFLDKQREQLGDSFCACVCLIVSWSQVCPWFAAWYLLGHRLITIYQKVLNRNPPSVDDIQIFYTAVSCKTILRLPQSLCSRRWSFGHESVENWLDVGES